MVRVEFRPCTASYMSPALRVCNYTTDPALVSRSRFLFVFRELTISPSFRGCCPESASTTGGKERRIASVGALTCFLNHYSAEAFELNCHVLNQEAFSLGTFVSVQDHCQLPGPAHPSTQKDIGNIQYIGIRMQIRNHKDKSVATCLCRHYPRRDGGIRGACLSRDVTGRALPERA